VDADLTLLSISASTAMPIGLIRIEEGLKLKRGCIGCGQGLLTPKTPAKGN
jgi:hypothetical protein